MRMNNAITNLIGEELDGGSKWGASLAAPNGYVYGIPLSAHRVSKFNPVDKSITYIGSDLGHYDQWSRGAITDNGIIYSAPNGYGRGILKIDTNTDNVTVLDANLLPERVDDIMWGSCAAAVDGCIYYMPLSARRIMKLDPNNNDAMTSVGDDLGDGEYKYIGTVVGIDGCVYGIPHNLTRIIKYDPINDTTSFVGKEVDQWSEENAGEWFDCYSGGAMGRDGCIYALTVDGRVLKIDTANNSHCFVGNSIQSDCQRGMGWCDAILGIDGCIYWAPFFARRTLKYDPHTNQTSLVGFDFGSERYKWSNGALATDGVIYYMPGAVKQVLAIDPLGEFSLATKTNMEENPEKFGFLFQINAENNNTETNTDTDTDTLANRTNFDCAVTKFGMQKVVEIVQEHMPPSNEVCGLYPFMLAASYKESPLWIVYVLLRQVPFLI